MNSCSALIPNGSTRKGCLTDVPTNLFPMTLGETFTNYLEIQNEEIWREKIQEDLSVYPTLPVRNVAVTKPSSNKETNGSGSEVTTRLIAGGVVVNLKTNACDFKEMLLSMQGGYYSVMIGLGANKVLAKVNSDGSLTGFTGQLVSIPTGVPTFDAKLEEFQLEINWDDVEEWNNYKIIELPFDLNEINEFTPFGLDAMIKTPLVGTNMVVNVTERCAGIPETETLEAEIMPVNGTNVNTPIVTPVVGTNGDYTVTVENGVATPLVAGEYIIYRLVIKTDDVYEKVSGWIKAKL